MGDDRERKLQAGLLRAVREIDPDEWKAARAARQARLVGLVDGVERHWAGDIERVLGITSREYWAFGSWLAGIEAAAGEQRECGNLLQGDGVGGERAGLLTSCQAQLAQVMALLEQVRALVDAHPGADIEVRVRGGEDEGRAWLAGMAARATKPDGRGNRG
jgi:hypothetical protein